MNAPTDWTTALLILAAGLILGALVLLALRRRKPLAGTKRPELEQRLDGLVKQLRDLGDDVADEERAWLEKETAEVLRALDQLPAPPAPPAAAPATKRSLAGAFALGVGCTLAIGAIVYYASKSAGDNTNVETKIAQAKDAFARNDLMAVFEQTNAVLAKNPEEPRALTYNAAVRLSMGEVDKASSMLERATKNDPKFIDAWVALAQARLHAGQQKEAEAAIEAAIKQHPEEEKRIREVFAAMQKGGQESQASLPPNHPPIPGSEMTMPPAADLGNMPLATAGAGEPIHITLKLAPTLTARGGTIYVIARGAEGGHPVAVRRINTNAFPVTLEFGAGDSMMGAALPERVRIEARLDADGDAGTNDPADLRASADGVRAGASIELELARAN